MAGVIKQLGKFKLPSDVSDLPLKGFANGLSEPVGLPNTPQNNLDQNSYTTAADMVTTEQMGNGSAACAIVNPPTLTQPNGLERPLPYLNWSHRYPPVQSSDK